MHTFRTGRFRTLTLTTATVAVGLLFPVAPAFADDTSEEAAPATIAAVSPASGTVAGGAVVTITGSAFTGATTVTFGQTSAVMFEVVPAPTTPAPTPALAAGTSALSVTTPAGTTTAATLTVRTFEDEVLRLVNAARAHKRKCGGKTYKAVKPLRSDATLDAVAASHSADMAKKDYFSHRSRSGASPFARMKAAGYSYRYAGENIAAGFRTPASVVTAWLKSSGHCRNIMSSKYTELGVGYATGGYYGTYWTQDFGRPR